MTVLILSYKGFLIYDIFRENNGYCVKVRYIFFNYKKFEFEVVEDEFRIGDLKAFLKEIIEDENLVKTILKYFYSNKKFEEIYNNWNIYVEPN